MSNVSTTTAAIYQAVLDSLNSSGECGVLPPAPPGKSAYEVAVDNGFVGSEKRWLNSLTIEQENEIARLEARIVDAEKVTKDAKYAASREVGVSGNKIPSMDGDYGLGGAGYLGNRPPFRKPWELNYNTGFYKTHSSHFDSSDEDKPEYQNLPSKITNYISISYNESAEIKILYDILDGGLYTNMAESGNGLKWDKWAKYYSTRNTDDQNTNGYLKPSSPILKIEAEHMWGNADGENMGATYTKKGVGDYEIAGTTGIRDDGWYIEIPNDINGNPKVAVTLETSDDGIVHLKTYKRVFNMETFTFEPDLDQPLDIPEGRWIDLRFNDLPEEPIVEEEVPVEEDPKD